MTLWLAVGVGDMGVSLLVLLNSMALFRYKTKFKDVPTEELESDAQMLICEACQTKKIIPQHHGRDMIQDGESLICWKKLLNSDELEICEEELPLSCPYCKNVLEVK